MGNTADTADTADDISALANSKTNKEIEIYLKNGAAPRVFRGHWNNGFRELIDSFEDYVKTKKQNKFRFNISTLSRTETNIFSIDFSEVAYIIGKNIK